MDDRIAYRGLTFDDVLLEPAYSESLPSEVDVSSPLTRNIRLNVPIISQPHGYGHRKRNGRRHGAGGRTGGHP